MKKLFSIAAVLSIVGTAAASQSQFKAPVTADVLHGWVQSDGSRMAALSLTLAPGWKTYWRAPGDGGIPPIFDWSGSTNLRSATISWPTPSVFDQNGMRSVGYENQLVIPVRIQPEKKNDAVTLDVHMDLGICSDVCVPYQLQFDAVLKNQDTRPSPAIAAALAQRPYSAAEAGVRASHCIVTPTNDGLQIETRVTVPSAGSPEHVVIEPGPSEIWVSEADTRRYGSELVAVSEMVHVSGGPISLDRSAIRITILGSNHAVDVQGCKPG